MKPLSILLLSVICCQAQWGERDFYFHGEYSAPPVEFQNTDRSQCDTTNIVINTNYTGTVTYGGQYLTASDLRFAASISAALHDTNEVNTRPMCAYVTNELHIEWQWDGIRSNNVTVSNADAFCDNFYRTNKNPKIGVFRTLNFIYPIPTGKELGYRSDGMVIWRETK